MRIGSSTGPSCVILPHKNVGYPRTGASIPAAPAWRPFAGALSASNQRQAAIILNTLFSWLVNAGYLAGNPLALSRERKRRAPPRVTRYLDEDLWLEAKATVDALPRETARERAHYFRLRWLISLCYICGLRISEIAANSMGAFFCRRDRDGEQRWWLEAPTRGLQKPKSPPLLLLSTTGRYSALASANMRDSMSARACVEPSIG